MTHKEQSDADTSGQLGPKRRVWGGSPTSSFMRFRRKANRVKLATVATVALLAATHYQILNHSLVIISDLAQTGLNAYPA
mgnify:FL=1